MSFVECNPQSPPVVISLKTRFILIILSCAMIDTKDKNIFMECSQLAIKTIRNKDNYYPVKCEN